MLEADVKGMDALLKTFNNLPRGMRRKAYMQALRAGAVPVRDAARDNIKAVSEPFTGLSRRNGTVRIYNLKRLRGAFRVAVMVRRGLVNEKVKDKDGKPVRVGMYLAVLEYGSQKLNRAPRPWIRNAAKQNQLKALSKTQSELYKRIDDALKDAKT